MMLVLFGELELKPQFAESGFPVFSTRSGRISAVMQILWGRQNLKMAPSIPFTLLLLVLAASLCVADDPLNGQMETKDGSQCLWFELRKSGRGSVFAMACHCKDQAGNKQSYSCEFDGPMEDCKEFQNNPKEFYEMLSTSLRRNFENPCKPRSFSIDECPNVTLERYKTNNDRLSPCVPEIKDEL